MESYDKLKADILAGKIAVNPSHLPASSKVFSVMFYCKELAEAVIQAIVGEDVELLDPLVEHRNDILKAYESCIWTDVYTKSLDGRTFTLDMQRTYKRKRSRNRKVYYAAKELATQEVKDMRHERLRQVSITFIYEENTTPEASSIAKIQLADTSTKEVYSDLLTLYEVNLNKISDGNPSSETILALSAFLTITTNENLCDFATVLILFLQGGS